MTVNGTEATTEDIGKNPAVQTAKEVADGGLDDEERIVTLRSGITVRLMPVPDILMQRAMSKIKEPPVPLWHNPEKERDEPNPADPDYLRRLRELEQERGMLSMDIAVEFGCELLDPIPEDDKWVKRLKRFGIEFDAADEFEREFAYKKYVAFANSRDLALLMDMDLSEADVSQAGRSFRGNEERPAHRKRQNQKRR